MVQGLDKLNRRWAKIPARVKEAVRREMEAQAQSIVDDMYSQSGNQVSGELASSIGWTWGNAPQGAYTIGVVAPSGGMTVGQVSVKGKAVEYGTMRITIYAGGGDAFYARFREFGTVKMHPRPFFFPVWRARRKKAQAGIRRAMKKGLTDT